MGSRSTRSSLGLSRSRSVKVSAGRPVRARYVKSVSLISNPCMTPARFLLSSRNVTRIQHRVFEHPTTFCLTGSQICGLSFHNKHSQNLLLTCSSRSDPQHQISSDRRPPSRGGHRAWRWPDHPHVPPRMLLLLPHGVPAPDGAPLRRLRPRSRSLAHGSV
jgi:hypothetical protein